MMNAVSEKIEIGNWESVCKLNNLIGDVGACVLVNGKQIAIFRLSGSEQLYAVDNLDPFSNANVLSRGICGDIKGQPVVASPIYKQHFNLQTGQCLEEESVKLVVYPVRVVDDNVQILKQSEK